MADGSRAYASGGTGNAVPELPSLGVLIGAYWTLSDAEKRQFQLATQLVPTVTAGGSGQPTATSVAIGPGQTRDPKTGKVYKLSAKKAKSQERVNLEAAVSSAKQSLAKYCGDVIRIQDDGNPQLWIDGHQGNPDERTVSAFNARVRALKAARSALEQYKIAHPEEFKPPPVKKAGKQPTEPQRPRPINEWVIPGVSQASGTKPEGSPSKEGSPPPVGGGTSGKPEVPSLNKGKKSTSSK